MKKCGKMWKKRKKCGVEDAGVVYTIGVSKSITVLQCDKFVNGHFFSNTAIINDEDFLNHSFLYKLLSFKISSYISISFLRFFSSITDN